MASTVSSPTRSSNVALPRSVRITISSPSFGGSQCQWPPQSLPKGVGAWCGVWLFARARALFRFVHHGPVGWQSSDRSVGLGRAVRFFGIALHERREYRTTRPHWRHMGSDACFCHHVALHSTYLQTWLLCTLHSTCLTDLETITLRYVTILRVITLRYITLR